MLGLRNAPARWDWFPKFTSSGFWPTSCRKASPGLLCAKPLSLVVYGVAYFIVIDASLPVN